MIKLIVFFAFVASAAALNSSYFIEASDYSFSTVQATYLQAYAICKKHGWSLASPRTSSEESDLNEALRINGLTYSFWLGGFYLKDQQFYPSWTWLEYGKPINYTNWASGQPKIADSTDHCLAQYGVGSDLEVSGKWLANGCNVSAFFACQTIPE